MNIAQRCIAAYINSLLWFTIGVTAGGIYVASLLIAWGAVK